MAPFDSGKQRIETPLSALPKLSPDAARVLFITPELAGFLKAGGLGEVSAYLPRVLREHGVDARILMPGYSGALAGTSNIPEVAELPGIGAIPRCRIAGPWVQDGLAIYFVICPELYERVGTPYADAAGREFADSDLRFARLCLAAAQIASDVPALGWKPDLVHANDWPAGLTPAYMRWAGTSTPSVLTVHNLAYQGLFDRGRVGALGIPAHAFQTEGVEFHGRLSFLKAGIFYATHVTTVSPTYAKEIVTPELGCGLDGLLRLRAERCELTGILNGVDESYDPRRDGHLDHHFGPGDLTGRPGNASQVREIFGLEDSAGPLFALVSRLVYQKGVDLVVEMAESILAAGGQIVVIGQGDPVLEQAVTGLAGAYPNAFGAHIGFNETLARLMYAGSDFLLMPSRFEPCGLSQMYAQRFGSLPVAHRTGGLIDTIQDGVTGFLFDGVSAHTLGNAVRRALRAFRSDGMMRAMQAAAMRRPGGWSSAAADYRGVYARALLSAA